MAGSFVVLKATRVAEKEVVLARVKEIEGAKGPHQVHGAYDAVYMAHGADTDGMRREPEGRVRMEQPQRHGDSGRCLEVADS